VFLIVKGRCVACALGAQEYFPESKRMTKDDALEGCRTNGLMRCLKNFGTFSNLWEGRWADACRERIGVKVRVSEGWPNQQWRRLDDMPLPNETGLAPGSPNAEAYAERSPAKPAPPRQSAPPEPRRAPEPTPPPPAHEPDIIEARARTEQPEKILVIRPVRYTNTAVDPPVPATMWVVNTDVSGEYVTNDEHVVKSLEQVKSQKKRVVIDYEPVRGRHGTRRRIIEYRVVD
jgi:hypothetical protein